MKQMLVALALVAGSIGVASAQGVQLDIGRGGVHVGPRYHDYDHRYRAYGRADCRLIISKRVNRFGERVTERRRICD